MKRKYIIVGAILVALLVGGVVYADSIYCTLSGMEGMLKIDCPMRQ